MRKVVRIPAGNTTYVHYNFVLAYSKRLNEDYISSHLLIKNKWYQMRICRKHLVEARYKLEEGWLTIEFKELHN
jgi:hypothetical protein